MAQRVVREMIFANIFPANGKKVAGGFKKCSNKGARDKDTKNHEADCNHAVVSTRDWKMAGKSPVIDGIDRAGRRPLSELPAISRIQHDPLAAALVFEMGGSARGFS